MQSTQSAMGSGRQARVTIADVARHLGVTKSTVSRALNGYPDIAEGTRLRISRAAEALGYRPLSHAQAIRTGRTRSIGLVLQIDSEDSARPFLADFIAGVTQAASDATWTVTIAAEPTEEKVRSTVGRLIEERKADGFILPRTLCSDPRVELLRDQDVPFIMFGRTEDSRGCAWFDIQGEDAMSGAVARLAALGHTRIAHIPGGPQYFYSQLRIDGFQKGLSDAGLPFSPDLIGAPAMTRNSGARVAHDLLTQATPPTAIVCAVDRAALGVYEAASELGLTVGQDVSLMAYDGLPEGAYATPGLTTYAVDSFAAGSRLAEMLIQLIRGADPEELRELAPPTLVERGSDRPPSLTPAELAQRVIDHHSKQPVQWEDNQ